MSDGTYIDGRNTWHTQLSKSRIVLLVRLRMVGLNLSWAAFYTARCDEQLWLVRERVEEFESGMVHPSTIQAMGMRPCSLIPQAVVDMIEKQLNEADDT